MTALQSICRSTLRPESMGSAATSDRRLQYCDADHCPLSKSTSEQCRVSPDCITPCDACANRDIAVLQASMRTDVPPCSSPDSALLWWARVGGEICNSTRSPRREGLQLIPFRIEANVFPYPAKLLDPVWRHLLAGHLLDELLSLCK